MQKYSVFSGILALKKLFRLSQTMRAMAKHSFNADDDAEEILTAVEKLLSDKTAFINRLISIHGRATIETIMRERQQTLDQWLRESPPPPKAPGKDTRYLRRPKQTA